MDMKTLIKPTRTGLQTIRKNFLNYASISTIVIASTFGTAINSANAADSTITTGGTDQTGTDNAGGTDATKAYDDVTIGNDTAANHVAYTMGDSAGDTFNIAGALAISNAYVANAAAELVGVTVAATFNVTGATTITSSMRVAGGVNTNSSSTLTLKNTSTFTGAVTLDEIGATDVASIILGDDSTASTITFNGGLASAAAGEGLLQVNAGGELTTVAGAIGSSTTRFGEVLTSTTATLSGAIVATEIDVDDDTTFSGTVDGTAINIATGKTATFTSDVTSGASHLTIIGTASIDAAGDQTMTGTIEGAGILDNANTDGTVTFATAIGANTQVGEIESSVSSISVFNATIDTALADVDGHITITQDDNTLTAMTLAATGTVLIDDTVTNGQKVFLTSTGVDADSLTSGGKIKMPANLSNGQSLELFEDVTNGDLAAIIVDTDAVLVDTALRTYAASSQTGDDIVVTVTDRTSADAATQLGTTVNDGTALLQATIAAATNGTTLDAFTNALNAEGGFSATEDTALAKQVAPQTDLISGSTFASKAVTGAVQGIMSNRMASLRSGDAYFGTGMAAGGLSAQSGFIQVFGSTADQKSTTVGSGTQAGYDADTNGYAIGFDGITDAGITVGVSFSVSETDVDGKGSGKASNNIDSYTASLYMDKATDSGYVEGSVTYGVSEMETSRKITSAGLNRSYTADYDADQISFNIGAGAPQSVGAGYVTPFGSFSGSFINTDAYTEKPSVANDPLRLKVTQDDVSSMVGSVGLKFHAEMDNGGTPMISLALNNEFGDKTIDSTNTFQGGGTAFKTTSAVEELSATLGLGYSYGSDSASIEIAYEADANDDDYLSHYGSIKLVGKF